MNLLLAMMLTMNTKSANFIFRELTQSGKTLDSDKEMSVMWKEC